MDRLRATVPIFLLAVIAVAPIPLASNRDWAWSPIGIVIGAILLIGAVALLFRPSKQPVFEVWLVVVAMMIIVVWVAIQTKLLSSSGGLDGRAVEVWDTEQSLTALMRLLTYCGVFVLAARFGQETAFADRLLLVIVGSGVVITLYGLVMQVDNGSCVVLGIVKAPIGSSCAFSATFRNANNYATYAGLGALICLAQIQARLLEIGQSSSGARRRAADRLALLGGTGGVLGAATLVLACGVFLSGSKAAAIAFFLASACMIALLGTAQGRRPLAALLTAAVVAVLLLIPLAIGGNMLLTRLLQFLTVGDADRSTLYSLAIDAIALRPWTGWGLGSFESVFSLLQPVTIAIPFDKAHNTYLETAIELGIIPALLAVAVAAILVARCIHGVFHRARNAHYPAIAVGASVLVGFQSSFDFSVQMPAVALAFSALLAMGVAQARSSRSQ